MNANGAISHVTDDTFASAVEQAQGLVVVDFWAEWCTPCRAIAPILEDLARSYDGKVHIAKLDVDANQRTSMRFNVRSIPTLLFFKNGQLVDSMVGLAPKAMLQARIEGHLGSAPEGQARIG
jgi:thioredoxin 1